MGSALCGKSILTKINKKPNDTAVTNDKFERIPVLLQRKNKKSVKKYVKMQKILLINGYFHEIVNRDNLAILIEQRILLFMDIEELSNDIKNNHLMKINRTLLKWTDERGIDVISPIYKTRFIWLGNETDSQNIKLLKELNINFVLNCAGNDVKQMIDYKQYGIKQCKINAMDITNYDIINKHLDVCFQFIDECYNTRNGKILIHCISGMNRSPTILVTYLMYKYNMNIFEAIEMTVIDRGWILTNESFKLQLIEYAKRINRL